ncbi:MAG: redoxin domain-containing protein [Proteobacteria bacterium]|nr:redoxin domain-containing protein [Pseudomonadota bacterium]MBU1583201.1 redoxin domain-containing protein [Pseudomonadota bacterium]MBU2627650.1 redoxin domain-containing protein [Pseudomonadota bacterium]
MKKLLILMVIFCFSLFLSACKQEQATLKVGDAAPDFSLIDRQGKTWSLSELRGQVVFINFWATWCPPCLKELPSMQNLYTRIPKDKFKILAVLNKDKPALADFVANQKGLTFTILDDEQNVVGSKYFLTGLPETFIIDKQGIIREKVIGAAQWDSPNAVQMIMNYINQ